MLRIRMIDQPTVSAILAEGGLREALEEALMAQSAGRADVPPRIAATAPAGMVAAMPGHLDGVGLAAKLVSIFPDNVDVPSHVAVVVDYDPATGVPTAIMDGEVITEQRTAVTAAIAADRLARPDAAVLTIVGAGAQGAAHVDAFARLRAWQEIRIVSRTRRSATVLAGRVRERLDAAISIEDPSTFAEAVSGSDVVALCTHADSAVIESSWVDDGAHVSSVGSQAELPTELVIRALGPVVVDHVGAATTPPPAGAAELQGLDPARVVELGAVLAAGTLRPEGRGVTVYKSTGHAVQDIAAARLVNDRASAQGLGLVIDL